MKLLVLGGTVFVGRNIVRSALDRGHEVTLFNRGRSGAGGLPAGVTQITGDRDGGLAPLESGRWDAVIDVSGYLPRLVRDSARLLAARCDRYVYVSSVSVYDDPPVGADESAPVGRLEDPTTETIDGGRYGPLKALCERAVSEETGGRCLVVRPGIIVGPHDWTGRFTYWPRRIATGGRVLAPDAKAQPVQLIDGRDLAAWILEATEGRKTGVYNAAGPATPLTFGGMVEACRTATGSDATIEWVDPGFLESHEVMAFVHLPMWVTRCPGFFGIDAGKALREGLRLRPLEETIRDTLAWDRSLGEAAPRGGAMSRETEERLLAAWDALPH